MLPDLHAHLPLDQRNKGPSIPKCHCLHDASNLNPIRGRDSKTGVIRCGPIEPGTLAPNGALYNPAIPSGVR